MLSADPEIVVWLLSGLFVFFGFLVALYTPFLWWDYKRRLKAGTPKGKVAISVFIVAAISLIAGGTLLIRSTL